MSRLALSAKRVWRKKTFVVVWHVCLFHSRRTIVDACMCAVLCEVTRMGAGIVVTFVMNSCASLDLPFHIIGVNVQRSS